MTVQIATTRGSKSLVLASGSGLAAILISIAVIAGSNGRPYLTPLLIEIMLLTLGLFVLRGAHGKIDLVNPLFILLVACLFMYTLQIVPLWYGTDQFSGSLRAFTFLHANELQAADLTCLALGCVLVGYVVAGRRTSEGPLVHRISTPIARNRSLAMIALGLALFVALLVSVHGLGNLVQNLYSRTTFFSKKNYLTIGPIIIASASVAWAIAENRWPVRPRIIATLSTGLILTLFIGAKTDLFIPIALMVAAVYYLWRRFRLISVVLGLVAMVAVLSLYNIYFRSALPQHISLSSAVAQSGGWTQLITHDFVGDTFLSQQVLTIAVAEFGQSHPYLGTSGVKAIVVAPVPRGLFPNKPASPSAAFTRSFDPQFLASGSTIPPTAFGEMYIDFGVPGVAIGSFVLGALLRVVYDRRFRSASWLYVSCVSSALIAGYVRGESYSTIVSFLTYLIPGLFILWGSGSALVNAHEQMSPPPVVGRPVVVKAKGNVLR